MIGQYENFPLNIHFLENFSSTFTIKKLQERLIETLKDFNRKPFCFEEISIPTIPNGEVIFEFGIAEGEGFNFLNEEAMEALQSSQYTPAVRASNAVSLLDEILQDPNMPPYTRVKLWNVMSFIEAIKD